MKLNRIIYLGYYLRKMDWHLLRKFFNYTIENTKHNQLSLIVDNLTSVFRYNISILEYYQFRFFEKEHVERLNWAGTGFMYEAIRKLNPLKTRYKLNDKLFFLHYYRDFVSHDFTSLKNLQDENNDFNYSRKIVLKHSNGQCGRGVEVLNNVFSSKDDLINRLKKMNNDMVEEYIYQHNDLNELSPSGLNTLRVITIVNKKGTVDILGVRLRISINSPVDNLAAGNIAVPVDEKTGVVNGLGVYSDITKEPVTTHPITNMKLVGFKIPRFHEAMNLAKKAALFDIDNRSVGWDIAISNEGTSLVEGNHDWCKLVWQLPVNKGLKRELERYVE